MAVLLVFAVSIFVFWGLGVYYLLKEWRDYRKLAVPGPVAYPFFGSLFAFHDWANVGMSFLIFTRYYGAMIKFKLPTIAPVLLITDPADIKEVFCNSFSKTSRSNILKVALPYFGPTGFFLSDHNEWRFWRDIFTKGVKALSFRRVVACTLENCSNLSKLFKESPQPLKMNNLLHRLALDINTHVTFGASLGALENQGLYDTCIDDIWNHFTHRAAFKSVFPYWLFWNTNEYLAYQRGLCALEKGLRKIFEDRLKDEATTQNGDDLLSFMIRERNSGSSLFPDSVIRDQMMTWLNGGTDTTSTLYLWMLYCVALNKNVENKILQELAQIMGDAEELTFAHVMQLQYCHWVVKETLRMFPPAPFFPRHLKEDIRLPSTGTVVPKGWDIWLPIFAIHHDPAVYRDPEKFQPKRWQAAKVAERSVFSWLPFTAGPRDCIGRSIGLLEAKTVLAYLIKNFEFQLVPCQELNIKGNQVMKPKQMLMFVKPRKYVVKQL